MKRKLIVIAIYFAIVILLPLISLFVWNDIRIPQKLIPQNADQFSREYISLLKQNDIEKASALTVQQANITKEQLTQFSSIFVSGLRLETLEVIGATTTNTSSLGNGTYYQMSYEAENATGDENNKYIVLQIYSAKRDNGLQLMGYAAKGSSKSVKEPSTFNFSKQGVYLIIAILTPLFIIYTAIYYVRNSPRPRWRVLLLILLIPVFISAATVNGAFRGGINIGVYSLVQKSGLGNPIVFNVQVPIGAIYYWIARKKLHSSDQLSVAR